MKKSSYLLLILLALGVFILFFRLGSVGLFEPDEGRYADIAREMVDSGDYLVPRMNFIEHFHKPPVTYWTIAASFHLFGFTETAVRFPSACAAVGLVIVIFLLARRLYDYKTAILSSLILLTSPLYFFLSRLATADMLFAFFVAASLCALIHAQLSDKRSRIWSLLGFFFLSLAVLTKGPIGLLIVFLSLAGAALFSGNWKRLGKINWIWGVLLFLVLALPWFIYLCMKYPGLANYFIFKQTGARIFSTHEHAKAFLYPFFVLLVGFIPWSVFVPWSIKQAFSQEKESNERYSDRFLLAWFILPFVFFSLIAAKQPAYILPLFPALAILTARLLKPFVMGEKESVSGIGKTSLWFLVVVCLGGSAALFVYSAFFIKPALLAAKPYLISLSALVLGAGFAAARCVAAKRIRTLFILVFVLVICIFFTLLFAMSEAANYKSRTNLINILTPRLKGGDKVIAYRAKTTALPFYTGRRIIEMGYPSSDLVEAKQFSDGSEADYYFREIPAIYPFLEGSARVFVLTKKENLPKIEKESKVPVYVLAEDRKWALFSNRKP